MISALLFSVALLMAILPGCSSFSGKARKHAGDINQDRKISGFYDTARNYQISFEKEEDAAPISARVDPEIQDLSPDEQKIRQVEEISPIFPVGYSLSSGVRFPLQGRFIRGGVPGLNSAR